MKTPYVVSSKNVKKKKKKKKTKNSTRVSMTIVILVTSLSSTNVTKLPPFASFPTPEPWSKYLHPTDVNWFV